jgi:hypothetical protein
MVEKINLGVLTKMKIGDRKVKFPIFFLIGLFGVILAFILKGKDLFVTTGIRFLLGIASGILVLILIAIFKKKSKGRANKVGK